MAFITQKPPWRGTFFRIITIGIIGVSLNFWVHALTDPEEAIKADLMIDPVLSQHEDQITSVICQINGKKKDVFLVSIQRYRSKYKSGRVSIRETVDTTFMGSVSQNIDCYQSLRPWVKALIKKDAIAHR